MLHFNGQNILLGASPPVLYREHFLDVPHQGPHCMPQRLQADRGALHVACSNAKSFVLVWSSAEALIIIALVPSPSKTIPGVTPAKREPGADYSKT